jgi:hypothetical protein
MHNAVGIPLNCGSFIGSNSPTYSFHKPSIGGDDFRLIASPITRVISQASSGILINKDVNLYRVSGATTITDYAIIVNQLVPGTYNITVTSSDTGILRNPDIYGVCSGVASGTVLLLASSSVNGSFSSISTSVNNPVGTTGVSFIGYVSGSLSKMCSDAIDVRIVDKVASFSKPIFSTQNHNSGIYVRNTGCWASGIDLTCISPWNSTDSVNRAGTLISPRHILFAAHYQINNGATIRFVDNNNNIITRTMVNKLTHPNYTPYQPDLTIGVLNSDVPSSIKFVKILPQNWTNYLPNLSYNYVVPCLVLDQEEKALISDLINLSSVANFSIPRNPKRYEFFENIVAGDSGNPAFLIINGELVLVTVWTYGGSGAGTHIAYYKDDINTMMIALGGGYTLTEISLNDLAYYV